MLAVKKGCRKTHFVLAVGVVAATVLVTFAVCFVLIPTVTVQGRVLFAGKPPPGAYFRVLPGEPTPIDESLVVSSDGSLANVFVYLKEGDAGSPPGPSEPVQVEERNCNFKPRVFGVRVGQPVEFKNRDPVVHNVNCLPRKSKPFNVASSWVANAPSVTKSFSSEEVMVSMHCDIHKWEIAFAGVLDHPYFAVTGPDGTFSFPEKLRPGIYTIVAWHERLGRLDQRVVCLGPRKTLLFTFELMTGGTKRG